MGIPKLVVETDCLVAVQALDAGLNSFAVYHHLLHGILTLKNYFEAFKFNYMSKMGNQVTHLLARSARIIKSTVRIT